MQKASKKSMTKNHVNLVLLISARCIQITKTKNYAIRKQRKENILLNFLINFNLINLISSESFVLPWFFLFKIIVLTKIRTSLFQPKTSDVEKLCTVLYERTVFVNM